MNGAPEGMTAEGSPSDWMTCCTSRPATRKRLRQLGFRPTLDDLLGDVLRMT